MTKKKDDDAPVVRAAIDLAETVEELERMTSRSGKLDLTTRNELLRAGELLQKAAEGHRAFLAHLGALTQAVSGLRDRQNASAASLSEHAQRLDERRKEHEAIEQRFATLGEAAREIGEVVRSAAPTEENGAGDVKARLSAAKSRLADAIETARVLAKDARDANFTELESQAHAIRQQIQALLRKIEELT